MGSPQGLVDFAASVLDKSVATAAMFGVFRHERDGPVDDEMRRRMRLVVPHIRRATLIARLMDTKANEAATLADSLDGLSAGMFLVDAEARVVHANIAGRTMLAAGDFLRLTSGRLTADEQQLDQELRDIVAAAGAGDEVLGSRGVALPFVGRGGERYVAHTLPLVSESRRRAGSAHAAAAGIFVHKATVEPPSLPETIARAYKLTLTELRVLLAIVEVGGGPEVAEALGMAASTVKTHLSRLYQKTGTRRQADLVKLVAGFATPLRPQS